MAIASTSSSTSAVSTSSLDVASIVSQLMTAENKPVDAIKSKISTQQVFISDLGKIKSDVAALQDALISFEDTASYSNFVASSTDTSVVTATAGVGATVGTHTISVSQAAQVTAYNISGFSTATDLISVDAVNGFQITIGSTIYSTDGSKTVSGVRTLNAISALAKTGTDALNQPASTATDLKNWINGLGLNISANLVQQNGSHWSIQVASSKEGQANDFSLTGLIGGRSFSGFSANNSAILLDPATGFELTVGGHVYSTLGTYDGSASGSVGTLASNTTIAALASWVNALNVNVSANVTGSAGAYSLELTPKNSASFSTIGLTGAYATGFNGSNEIVNLDPTNGFQVSVGGKTYKTAGSGAIAITGSGVGGGVTVSDLATWINSLSGANLSAIVVGSGSNYSLEVNNTDLLASAAITLSGIDSATGANITTVSGFESATSLISLDAVDGFQITIGATTYKTTQGGASVGGHTVPTLATSGLGSTSTIDDLKAWINSLSSTYGLGLTAAISNAGSPYSLSITGVQAVSIAGINPNVLISGFNASNEGINLGVGGFSLSVGNTTYKSNGDKIVGAVTTSTPGNALAANPTLSSLNSWINSVAGLDVSSSIVGSGTSFSLLVAAKNSANAVSVAGLSSASRVVAQSISGFNSASDPISLDATNGFQITLGGTTYNTKTSGTTLSTSYVATGGAGLPSLTDLEGWINALSATNNLHLNAAIQNGGSGTKTLEITQTGGSALPLSVSGINSSVYESGFTSSSSAINLDATSGFELQVGSTVYSTKGLGGASLLASPTTITDLKNWINGLGGGAIAQADFISTGSDYQLFINSLNGQTISIPTGIINGSTTVNSGANPVGTSISASVNSSAPIGANTISITQTASARTVTYTATTNLITLDPTNGLSLTFGGVTYKTTQSGLINGHTIPSLTNNGGSSTVDNLATWINSLSTTYGLGITATASTIAGTSTLTIAGTTGLANDFSVTGLLAPATNISGFSSPNAPIGIASGGFSIAIGGGASFSTNTTAISGTGPGGGVTLSDLRDWINARSMGVTASISGSGSSYLLKLLQTGDPSTLTVSGLIPDVAYMGFPSANATLNLDPTNGFRISAGGATYSTITTPITGTGTNNAITATDLKNWINSLRSGGTQVFNANLVGSGSNFSLNVSNFDPASTSAISLSGVLNATASSNSNLFTVSSNSSAVSGTHPVNVTQNAAATVFNIGGFANANATVDVNNSYLIVGTTVYYADGRKKTGATIGYDGNLINTVTGGNSELPVDNLIASSLTNDGLVTIQQLSDWINSLNDHVSSEIQATANGGSQLHVNGTLTGIANAVALTYIGRTNIGDPGGSLGVTSISQNGGITEQGSRNARAFILKGTSSDYVLVDDPRNIVYDGSARFWQGPASAVDPNYVNDTSRGQYLNDGVTWIGQPGVVLDQSQGQIISVTAAFTGSLQSNGTVSLNYDYNSSVNNVTIARNAKGTLDGQYFESATNAINNVVGSGINLNLIQSVSPYDSAVSANVIIGNPTGYSNTPSTSSPATASISRSTAARDTLATINGSNYTQANLGVITANGVSYSYSGTVANGGTPIAATVNVLGPSVVNDAAIVSGTGTPQTLSTASNQTSTTSGTGANLSITTVSANNTSAYALDGGVSKYTTAQDAQLSIDGVSVVRSANTISDFISGVTFQIMSNPSPGQIKNAKVNIALGSDNTESKITGLMTAYNKLIMDYNALTANANNGKSTDKKTGTFGNSPTTLSFVENIKRRFATGATYNIGTNDANGNPYILSLASLGLDYQLDGTLKYNSIAYLTSQSSGLRDKFLKGLRIGYVSPTDNLMTFVKAQSSSTGALAQEMTIENNSIDSLTKEQENLQTRLNKIQDNYIAQYSGLNALLFQLNSTSTNLGSALDSLKNMAASK